jgi:hypothetical protein
VAHYGAVVVHREQWWLIREQWWLKGAVVALGEQWWLIGGSSGGSLEVAVVAH